MSGGTPNFRGVTPNFRGVTPKIRGDTPKIRGIPLKLGVPNNDSIVLVQEYQNNFIFLKFPLRIRTFKVTFQKQ